MTSTAAEDPERVASLGEREMRREAAVRIATDIAALQLKNGGLLGSTATSVLEIAAKVECYLENGKSEA